jgi:hypothetical protein
MQFQVPVKTGELDPVLSSLFRVTDGVLRRSPLAEIIS